MSFNLALPGSQINSGCFLASLCMRLHRFTAGRLRLRIQSERLEINGATIGVTASFGVAFVNAGGCFDAAVSRADDALYEAKARGRNQVVINAPVELVA